MVVKLSSKGQVTIPKQVRESLSLKAGDEMLIEAFGNDARIIPLRRVPLSELKGIFKSDKPPLSREEMQDIFREAAVERDQRVLKRLKQRK